MSSRCLKLYHAYSISFNLTNVGTFLGLKSKDCIRVQEKKKKVVVVCSTKREIRHFVVVAQWRQRNVQKGVMYVQSCCFAIINLLLFCRSRCRRRRRCLSSSQTDTWTHFKATKQYWIRAVNCILRNIQRTVLKMYKDSLLMLWLASVYYLFYVMVFDSVKLSYFS